MMRQSATCVKSIMAAPKRMAILQVSPILPGIVPTNSSHVEGIASVWPFMTMPNGVAHVMASCALEIHTLSPEITDG